MLSSRTNVYIPANFVLKHRCEKERPHSSTLSQKGRRFYSWIRYIFCRQYVCMDATIIYISNTVAQDDLSTAETCKILTKKRHDRNFSFFSMYFGLLNNKVCMGIKLEVLCTSSVLQKFHYQSLAKCYKHCQSDIKIQYRNHKMVYENQQRSFIFFIVKLFPESHLVNRLFGITTEQLINLLIYHFICECHICTNNQYCTEIDKFIIVQ